VDRACRICTGLEGGLEGGLDPGVAWVAWWVYGPFTVKKGVIGVWEGRGCDREEGWCC
jgi:hypothetical protein